MYGRKGAGVLFAKLDGASQSDGEAGVCGGGAHQCPKKGMKNITLSIS